MSIIHLPDLERYRRLPLIIFTDLQKEFVAAGRALSICSAEQRLDAIRCLLKTSRSLGLPIAHFRRAGNGYFFNEATQFGGWIEGFNPRPNEFIYMHSKPSCFNNDSFKRMLEEVAQPTLVIAGFSSDEACLSTVVDAYHFGYNAIFLEDCSATSKLGDLSEDQSHQAVCSVIKRYARVMNRQTLYGELASAANAHQSV